MASYYLHQGTRHRGVSRWFSGRVDTYCRQAFPRTDVRTPWFPFLHPACPLCEAVHLIEQQNRGTW